MDPNTFPTKGNLILAKSSLTLARQGYELMDKKRNILIKELMGLIEEAKGIQSEIDTTFTAAYKALQKANIELGINYVQDIAAAVPVDDTVRIKTRSIMGTEIPLVHSSAASDVYKRQYGAYQDPQHHGYGDSPRPARGKAVKSDVCLLQHKGILR